MGKMVRSFALAVIAVSIAFTAGGCSVNGEPRTRLGSYATPTAGTNFIDINNLGTHSYGDFRYENNGIVYTCRGGHIDIAHVRIAADYVKYLYIKTRKNLINADPNFSFKMNIEPSMYFVHFDYPPGWEKLSKKYKGKIATEISLELSQYFAYTITTWHEVLTWFGFKSLAVFSEFPSAFSWEDNYSNLVGARLGAVALQDKKHKFNEAMTIALKKELENLGVRPRQTAQEASEKMRGKWFDGNVSTEIRERNMDLGFHDGYVTPTLIPGVCVAAKPKSYPAPTRNTLSKYGLTMTFEVEPKEYEKDVILKMVYPDGNGTRIQFPKHLPLIMFIIKKEAAEMGYNTMPPKN